MKSNEEWSSQVHTKIQDINEIVSLLAKCTTTEVLQRLCFQIFIVHNFFTVLTSVANEKNSFLMREFLEDCSQYLSESNEPKTLREKRQKN